MRRPRIEVTDHAYARRLSSRRCGVHAYRYGTWLHSTVRIACLWAMNSCCGAPHQSRYSFPSSSENFSNMQLRLANLHILDSHSSLWLAGSATREPDRCRAPTRLFLIDRSFTLDLCTTPHFSCIQPSRMHEETSADWSKRCGDLTGDAVQT